VHVVDSGLQPEAAAQQRPRDRDPRGGLDPRRLPLLPAVPEHELRPPLRDRHLLRAQPQRDLARGQTTKQYEDEAKRRFIEEPANMTLLSGFDAPSCTYI